MGLFEDYLLFIKLFAFLYFARWALENFGDNKILFALAILVLGYYIFFARWTILGTLIVFFFVFILHGVGGFIQDLLFQYDMVAPPEMEERLMGRNLPGEGGYRLPWQRW